MGKITNSIRTQADRLPTDLTFVPAHNYSSPGRFRAIPGLPE